MARYRILNNIIRDYNCKIIMEIGVYNGDHALSMINTSIQCGNKPDDIFYYGFDLFEDISKEDVKSEFAKVPLSMEDIKKKLDKSGANFFLFKGYSRDTLPKFIDSGIERDFDFVFIDGGHSHDTIKSDWSLVKQIAGNNTVVLFDDYTKFYDGNWKWGCNKVIDSLDRSRYSTEFVGDVDRLQWGTIKMVKVMLK